MYVLGIFWKTAFIMPSEPKIYEEEMTVETRITTLRLKTKKKSDRCPLANSAKGKVRFSAAAMRHQPRDCHEKCDGNNNSRIGGYDPWSG